MHWSVEFVSELKGKGVVGGDSVQCDEVQFDEVQCEDGQVLAQADSNELQKESLGDLACAKLQMVLSKSLERT